MNGVVESSEGIEPSSYGLQPQYRPIERARESAQSSRGESNSHHQSGTLGPSPSGRLHLLEAWSEQRDSNSHDTVWKTGFLPQEYSQNGAADGSRTRSLVLTMHVPLHRDLDGIFGGLEGSRTPYLMSARQALSQLSYEPISYGCVVDRDGLEPSSLPCEGSILPIVLSAHECQWQGVKESNPLEPVLEASRSP